MEDWNSDPSDSDDSFILILQSGRKETVLDLAKFVDKGVQVKLTGGRQGPGICDVASSMVSCVYCVISTRSYLRSFQGKIELFGHDEWCK